MAGDYMHSNKLSQMGQSTLSLENKKDSSSGGGRALNENEHISATKQKAGLSSVALCFIRV